MRRKMKGFKYRMTIFDVTYKQSCVFLFLFVFFCFNVDNRLKVGPCGFMETK